MSGVAGAPRVTASGIRAIAPVDLVADAVPHLVSLTMLDQLHQVHADAFGEP